MLSLRRLILVCSVFTFASFGTAQEPAPDPLFFSSDGSTTSSDTSTTASMAPVRDLLAAEDFLALEDRFTTERLKVNDGDIGWDFDRLYADSLAFVRQEDEATTDSGLQLLQRWIAAHPDSITPYVLLIELFVERAWDHRGSGLARDVTEEGWKGFRANLRSAEEVVREAYLLKGNDPRLFAIWLTIGMGRRYPADLNDRILQEGLQFGPRYASLYTRRALQLLPRWYGEPGELEDFAASAAEDTSETHSQGFYTLTALVALNAHEPIDHQTVYNFDWPRLRQGFLDLHRLYPDDHFLDQLLVFSCLFEDRETAASIFPELDPGVSRDWLRFWNDDIEPAYSRWALEDGPYPGKGELLRDVKKENFPGAKHYLDRDHPPDFEDHHHYRLIEHAILNRDFEMLDLLLKAGANPNYSRPNGQRPLNEAVASGRIELVKLLIDAGAEVNAVGFKGNTPLNLALERGYLEIAEYLRGHGATVAKAPAVSNGVLFKQLANNNTDLLLWLLELGLKPSGTGPMGWTPLHYAAHHGNLPLAEALLEIAPDLLLAQDNDGRTPIEVATLYRKPQLVTLLNKTGKERGFTPDQLFPTLRRPRN